MGVLRNLSQMIRFDEPWDVEDDDPFLVPDDREPSPTSILD